MPTAERHPDGRGSGGVRGGKGLSPARIHRQRRGRRPGGICRLRAFRFRASPGRATIPTPGLDVSNKIALVLRYVPEQVDTKRRAELNQYAGVRYKAMHARERGAKGVIFVTGPTSPNAGELIKMSSDSSLSGSGIPIACISSNVAAALFAGSGKDLGKLQAALDTENPHAESGIVLTNVRVSAWPPPSSISGKPTAMCSA